MPRDGNSIAGAATRAWSMRRVLATAHLCIGLVLGIPLVLLGLSGSVLVFEDQLHDWFDAPPPAMAVGELRAMADVLDAARRAAPTNAAPTLVLLPERPDRPVVVRFAAPGAGAGPGGIAVPVDPVSLQTFGPERPNEHWLRQVFNLHAQLFVSGRDGRWLVGWFGIAMVVLGFSGMVMWWPRRKPLVSALRIDRGKRGAPLLRNIHGTIGLWMWCVFMAVSGSSLYLAYPETVGEAVRAVLPGRDLRLVAAPRVTATATPVSLDKAIAAAHAAVPDGSPRMIALPQRADQPFRINFAPPGHASGTPMIGVFVDPRSARVLEIRDPRQFTAGETVLAWQHAVHAGDGFGWPWRALVFVSGLLPTLFVGTGAAHWILRRRGRNRARPGPAL